MGVVGENHSLRCGQGRATQAESDSYSFCGPYRSRLVTRQFPLAAYFGTLGSGRASLPGGSTPSSSTSKINVAWGPIALPAPSAP